MAWRQADVRDRLKQTAVTTWHESHGLRKSNPKEAEAEQSTLTQDLKVLNETLVRVRRERIRELYTAEMTALQAELAAKGLTIETKRD